MRESLKLPAGFTLLEVMITVAIVGILAALAIPNFMDYQCKSLQSDAKTNLGAIFTAQEAYYSENNIYAICENVEDFKLKLGWYVVGKSNYTYSTTRSSRTSFTGTADGMVRNKSDVWKVNQHRKYQNEPNACQ